MPPRALLAWTLLFAASACAAPLPEPPSPDPPLPKPRPASSAPAAAPPLTSLTPPPTNPSPPTPHPSASPSPRRTFAGGGPASVAGKHGIVTSSEAQATRAGVAVLERGGNAVDAAVATAFALAVTHPSAGNIGGGGFMLVRPAGPEALTTAFDFRETAPAALTREGFDRMQLGGAKGGAAAGVPGSVAGLLLAHQRFGKLPRADIVAPALELAQKGYVLGRRQAELLAASFKDLVKDPALAKRFGSKDKKPKGQGARITQPELAQALLRIQEDGAAGFYTGPTAVALARAPGSLIRPVDLERYRVVERIPLRSSYRGLQVETMPPPSAGGAALTEILGLLERLAAHDKGGVEEIHLFLEASRRAQAERRFGVSDPDGLDPAAQQQALSRFLDPQALLARAPIDHHRATPSRTLAPLYPGAVEETEQTTHLSVVDAQGMVVSLTTTISASFGAKLTAPGTGIILNNSVASFSRFGPNQPAPGRRTTSSMAPTLVLDQGQVVMVLGTPGGDTIPSTIATVLRHVVDHNFPLDQAVAAPRIHQSFLPDRARFETKRPLDPALVAALKARGHDVSGSHLAMGDSNDLLIDDGQAFGVADPRGGGLALAAKPASSMK
ncbi:MAG TPA: gamma-glutamyltransferase [Polyangiaceae bacterium]|nr:gamma-glutamyltransferase [Polyangiaceae bacterium]